MTSKDFPEYTNIPVYDNTLKLLLLQPNPELLDLLERIIKWEEEMRGTVGYELGFRPEDVFGDPRTIASLVPRGILYLSYRSASDRRYRVLNLEEVKRAIEDFKRLSSLAETEEKAEIPEDLFSFIVGHDDVKDLLWRAIRSDRPVHILFAGVPASAKSLFLEELRRLPKSKFVLGSGLTRAGLYDVIFESQPRYLIIDEIDKIKQSDNLACLLSLMERGIVVETKHRKHRSIEIVCSVFAGANRVDKLPPELLSRFLVLNFRPYTQEEFIEVAVHVLTKKEDIPEQIALYIAQRCLQQLGTRDPRDPIKIARLLKKQELTRNEVDKIIQSVKQRKIQPF
jgi:Holliday junction DNA helicase RuvB